MKKEGMNMQDSKSEDQNLLGNQGATASVNADVVEARTKTQRAKEVVQSAATAVKNLVLNHQGKIGVGAALLTMAAQEMCLAGRMGSGMQNGCTAVVGNEHVNSATLIATAGLI